MANKILDEVGLSHLWGKINNKFATITSVEGLTASDVGADAEGSAAQVLTDAKAYNDAAYANANAYTDQKIADLINGAPTTLDTLKEISDAMAENEEVVDALDKAIGTKANQSELDTHTGNDVIHVTADNKTAWDKNTTDIASIVDGTTVVGAATKSTFDGDGNKISETYLQKAGGVLNDNLQINTERDTPFVINRTNASDVEAYHKYYVNGTELGGFGYYGANNPVVLMNGSVKTIATTADLADYLPKSGGKVGTASSTPFSVENTGSGNVMIDFLVNGVRQGLFGFNGVDNPIFYDTNHKEHPLLHTGNKPSGSYTGNGDAAQRTINIGGIGYCIAIWSETTQTMAIVTRGGAICKDASGNITTLTNIDLNLLYCDSSIQLILVTNNPVLNENGITYKYAVL